MHPKFQEAISLFQKRKFKEAKSICEEILEIEPKNFDVMHFYGIISYQTGNYTLSAELINKAITINSNNAEAYNNLGLAFTRINKFDSALESFNQAIKINSNFFEAYNNRGLIFIKLERFKDALDKRFKETLGLLFHGVDKVIVLAVFGIETVVGLVAPQVCQVQPLIQEALDEPFEAWVRKHAGQFKFENFLFV